MEWRCVVDVLGDVPTTLCPPNQGGDIGVNAFGEAERRDVAPGEVADEWAARLRGHPDVLKAVVVGGHVNATLAETALYRETIADIHALVGRCASPLPELRKVMVEFSSPSVHQAQHLDHLRSAVLGQAVCNLLAKVGHDVVRVNLVGDRGLPVFEALVAYLRRGDGPEPPDADTGDAFVGELHGEFECGTDDREAQGLLARWERGEIDMRVLWHRLTGWTLTGFESTYRTLGLSFDRTHYESEMWRAGALLVRAGVASGAFHCREDGAIAVDLSGAELGEEVLLRRNGTPVRMALDLAATVAKVDDEHPDEIVWIVADGQERHFQVLSRLPSMLGHVGSEYARTGCTHLSCGSVSLKSGPKGSRAGNAVLADGLIEETADRAREEIVGHGGADDDDLDARASAVALAAIRFALLRPNRRTQIVFDPDKALDFHGSSGPFLQHAHARLCSILRLVKVPPEPDWGLLVAPAERDLALLCSTYPEVVRKAAAQREPAVLSDMLFKLARGVERWCTRCAVAKAGTPELRGARAAFCDRVRQVLAEGLKVLGIEPLGRI